MTIRETIMARKKAERTAKAQARAKAKADARARRARRLGKKPTSSGASKQVGEAVGNLAGNFFSRLSGQRADSNKNRKKTTSTTRRTRSPSLTRVVEPMPNSPERQRRKNRKPVMDTPRGAGVKPTRTSPLDKRQAQLNRISKRVSESKLGQRIKKNTQKLKTFKDPAKKEKVQQRLKKQISKAGQRMNKAQTRRGIKHILAGVAKRA